MQAYNDFLDNFEGESVRLWMEKHVDVAVVMSGLYLVLVLWVPTHFMKDRPAYNLKALNTLWNLLLSVFSMLGAYYTIPVMIQSISGPYQIMSADMKGMETRPGDVHDAICGWNPNAFYNGPAGFYVMLFILSKIPEMMDTVFLVFQKKRVIFLHWYHHITVMLYCWHAYTNLIGSGLIFASMNYGVHSIMYTYYLICALGYRSLVRPFAPLITALQILQMVVGTAAQLYSIYHLYFSESGCFADASNVRMGTMMYVSYFILFSKLFSDSYLSSGKPKSVSENKKLN